MGAEGGPDQAAHACGEAQAEHDGSGTQECHSLRVEGIKLTTRAPGQKATRRWWGHLPGITDGGSTAASPLGRWYWVSSMIHDKE